MKKMRACVLAAALVALVPCTALAQGEVQYQSPSGKKYYAQADAKDNVTQLLALADAQAGLWNIKEAIRIYDRVLALDPGNATAYQQRGHRNLSIRELQKARADLEKATSMDPKLVSAWYYLGVLDYAGRLREEPRASGRRLHQGDRDRRLAVHGVPSRQAG
jgi:tetratricopeptide (TPR) repeat protein